MTIPEEILSSIRERVSLVEIAGETVSLKRVGRNWVGLCPFHPEKTPSFNIREEEGTFCCFGCGKKGSVFDYIMETKRLTFPEAVQLLANRIGVKLPDSSRWKKSGAGNEDDKAMRRVVWFVEEAYRELLEHEQRGARGREYLARRGLNRDTIKRFRLGYAPPGWEFLERRVTQLAADDKVRGREFTPERIRRYLAQAGLLKARRGREGDAAGGVAVGEGTANPSGHYDVFRDRVVFPITRSDGMPIAFGGRVIEAAPQVPKYLNTSESPLYKKRKSFFGLSQALESLRRSRHVFIVEGYLDVLSMAQRGLENTLATCGTAVTPEHAQVLKRLVDRATLIFDGDVAGRKAAASCFDVFLNSGIELTAVLLDEGEDPDSMAQKLERHELEALFSVHSRPLHEVFIDQLFSAAGASAATAGAVVRGKVADGAAERLRAVKNPVEREALLVSMAPLIGVNETALRALLRGRSAGAAPATARGASPATPPAKRGEPPLKSPAQRSPTESYWREILAAVLIEPRYAQQLLDVLASEEGSAIADFAPPGLAGFLNAFLERGYQGLRELRNLPEAYERERESMAELCREYELSELRLMDEASRCLRVGGVEPARLIAELASICRRLGLSGEVAALRVVEERAVDEREREALIQEKLLIKRRLEKLRDQT